MIGFPLIKRRATAAVARFREKLSATKQRATWCYEDDGRSSSGPALSSFLRSPRVAYFRRRYVGDDGSRSLFARTRRIFPCSRQETRNRGDYRRLMENGKITDPRTKKSARYSYLRITVLPRFHLWNLYVRIKFWNFQETLWKLRPYRIRKFSVTLKSLSKFDNIPEILFLSNAIQCICVIDTEEKCKHYNIEKSILKVILRNA